MTFLFGITMSLPAWLPVVILQAVWNSKNTIAYPNCHHHKPEYFDIITERFVTLWHNSSLEFSEIFASGKNQVFEGDSDEKI